jgi:tetratricopeptide (TPR) repeat protein
MRKKILFPATFLLFLLFLTTAASAAADASDQLKQADTLTEAGQYQQAEQIYRQVAADYPGTDYALEAQKGLVVLYVKTNEDDKAQAAFDKLIADFSWHKGIAEAIWDIGVNYNQAKKSDKAYQIHQYNVEHFPDNVYAMRSQAEIVFSHIRDANDAAADAAVIDLLSIFSQQPTLPKEIYDVAREYEKFQKYEKALELYQQSVENFPHDIHAMMSQTGIAKYHIRAGNDAAADAAFAKLLTTYSEQPTLPQQIHYVARKYEEFAKYDKALELYQYNVASFPNDIYTMWSQVRIVRSHIRDGNHAAADAAFDILLTLFSDQPTLAREVYKIANKFSQAGNSQKAHQLYQYIIGRWSSDVDINSRKSVVMSYICLGLDAEAESAIQTLTNDFKDHPGLPVVLWQVAEADYDLAFRCEKEGLDAQAKEHFLKVINTGEGILKQWPDSSAAPEICYISAVCYERLDEYAKAIEHYQKVVDNWSDYRYAWNAQFLIARNYERLLDREGAVHPQIVAQIKNACEQVLQNYPDCPAAGAARDWLQSNTDFTGLIEGGQK